MQSLKTGDIVFIAFDNWSLSVIEYIVMKFIVVYSYSIIIAEVY